MKRLFLLLLLFVASLELVAQSSCYDIVHSHNGEESILSTTDLQDEACALKAALAAGGINEFAIIGHDYYPLLAYKAPYNYYNTVFDRELGEVQSANALYILIAKDHKKNGELNYRIDLKLPTSGSWSGLTPFEREAIKQNVINEILTVAEAEEYLSFRNWYVEKRGLEKLRLYTEQINSGTLSLENPMNTAGFALFENADLQRGLGSQGNRAFGNDYIYDFAGLEYNTGNSFIDYIAAESVNGSADLVSLLPDLNRAFIVTDDLNSTAELNAAQTAFENADQTLVSGCITVLFLREIRFTINLLTI